MTLTHFIELLLLVAILIAVGIPLFNKLSSGKLFSSRNPVVEEYKHMLVRKEEILLSIKELEFDFKIGKISSEDYGQMMKLLESEALEVLEKIDLLERKKKDPESSTRKLEVA